MTEERSDRTQPRVGAKKLKNAIHEKLDHVVLWDATDIRIKVNKGMVTLMGTVGASDDIESAEKLVRSIDGVTAVKNQLKVKGPGLASVISEIASELTRVMTDEEEEHKRHEHPDSTESRDQPK